MESISSTKQTIKERFSRICKGCTLYAAHLDGFTHKVFYKDALGKRHIDVFSAYAPEMHDAPQECYNDMGQVCIKSFNADTVKVLFLGYGHIYYQGNAQELIFEDVSKWKKDTEINIKPNGHQAAAAAM